MRTKQNTSPQGDRQKPPGHNPKTIKERIKSFVRAHIHTGDGWRTPVKLKKTGKNPAISAQHHTYLRGKAHTSPKPLSSSFGAPKRANNPKKDLQNKENTPIPGAAITFSPRDTAD